MKRILIGTVITWCWSIPLLLAQDDIQKGTIKKVDAAQGILSLTVDGKDRDFTVTDKTKVMDGVFQEITDRLKDPRFKVGAKVLFKAVSKGNEEILLGLKLENGEPGAKPQPEGIQRGKIKTLDVDKLSITVIVNGKERTFALLPETQVLGATGKDLKEKLKDFKADVETFFKAEKRAGKDVVTAMKLADGVPGPGLLKVDSSKLKPLSELGAGEYQGFKGGFYPDGKKDRPAGHETAGLALAKQVQPLNQEGKPSKDGKVVLLSIGMSNTSQASQGFQKALAGFADKAPNFQFVNGAQGGMTASAIQDPEDNKTGTRFWETVDERLKAAGVTRAQVQAIWIKQADAGPSQGWPKYTQKLEAELTKIVQLLPGRFPNAKLVYLSSRTYGGYAKTGLNPEPYAYESAFSVKWLIEKQINGDAALNYDAKKGTVKAPWVSWGPYLWANGETKRADGFFYEASDFTANDGTHLSPSGQQKVGNLMLEFFKTDATAKPWFVSNAGK